MLLVLVGQNLVFYLPQLIFIYRVGNGLGHKLLRVACIRCNGGSASDRCVLVTLLNTEDGNGGDRCRDGKAGDRSQER